MPDDARGAEAGVAEEPLDARVRMHPGPVLGGPFSTEQYRSSIRFAKKTSMCEISIWSVASCSMDVNAHSELAGRGIDGYPNLVGFRADWGRLSIPRDQVRNVRIRSNR